MRFQPADLTTIVGLVIIGVVSTVAILFGGVPGVAAGSAGLGSIGGWLTRSSGKPGPGPGDGAPS